MNKQGVLSKLAKIDEELFFVLEVLPEPKPTIIVIGGAALIISDLSSKQVTKDIDIFHAEHIAAETLYADPDINAASQTFACNLPYNYRDRATDVTPASFRVLRVLVPSPEDLAVMKLYRWEEPDKADLLSPEYLAVLDWDLLDHLVFDEDEAAASRIALPDNDREFRQMLRNYDEYRRMAGHGNV